MRLLTAREKLKFKNTRVKGFDSKLEKAVYEKLFLMMKAGMISEIKKQVTVELLCSEISDKAITYRPDFSYKNKKGETIWVEAKGKETSLFRLKKRLWKRFGPGELQIWKGTYQKPFVSETIYPLKQK